MRGRRAGCGAAAQVSTGEWQAGWVWSCMSYTSGSSHAGCGKQDSRVPVVKRLEREGASRGRHRLEPGAS